jgi:hypothetical protein
VPCAPYDGLGGLPSSHVRGLRDLSWRERLIAFVFLTGAADLGQDRVGLG